MFVVYFVRLIIVKVKFWVILMFLENAAKLPCGNVVSDYTFTIVRQNVCFSTLLPTMEYYPIKITNLKGKRTLI